MGLLENVKQYFTNKINEAINICDNCGIKGGEIWYDSSTGKSFCSRMCIVIYSFRTGELINATRIK